MKLMKTPKSVDLALTSRCNLRCKYCSHFTGAGDVGKDLPTQEWLKFFEELNRCSVLKLTLQGGEVFIREDLKELITGIVRNRMRFEILSNGTLITEEIADFLVSTGRCDSIQVSIDGSIPDTHDVFRGKGTFDKAIKGIRNLQKYNISVAVRVTIHRQNVKDLEGIAALLLEEIGLRSFSTNSAGHMGICRQFAKQVQLTTADRTLAMETLLKLNQKYNGRISASAGPLAEAKHWAKMVQAHRKGKESFSGGGFLTSCGGPMSKLGVRADGVIIPCPQISHIELGRINKDNLKEIWQNHPELKRLRERRYIPLNSFEFCQNCEYINYCRGNCPALAYTILGRDDHPSPDACLKRFLEAGGKLPCLN